jgi:hypothetical protein
LKILHILVDDKFIDMAIREYEAVSPGVHEFVLVNASEPYRYVRHEQIRNLASEMFATEIRRPEIRAVIFHSLPEEHYQLLKSVPIGKKVFWLGWGYDYYGSLLATAMPDGNLLPRTSAIVRPNHQNRFVKIARSTIKKGLQTAKLYPKSPDISVLNRVDYFSPVIDTEFRMALDNNPWFSPQYICWNYGTVEDDLALEDPAGGSPGNNLLVGNSATPTNNHYEIFESIRRQIDLSGRQVIVPLSYGDPDYRNQVLRFGRAILGAAFTPLVDFMPREQYIETLNSCGFVMMNQLRQQALGNICISTLLGAKVFLHTQNPLHGWLQAKGLVVGDVEHLDTIPLTTADRLTNIQVIRAHWGRQVQREKTRRVVETALS